jgi:hypothetical protein
MPRRGNPRWAAGHPSALRPAAMPTEFETRMRELHLTQDTCAASHELRRWCENNRNRHYVPEWLLKAWGIRVDPDVS